MQRDQYVQYVLYFCDNVILLSPLPSVFQLSLIMSIRNSKLMQTAQGCISVFRYSGGVWRKDAKNAAVTIRDYNRTTILYSPQANAVEQSR